MKYHIDFDIELRRNPYKGLYIAFEGIDGSGKTTQVERLKKYFEEKKPVVLTSEPRISSLVGRLIYDILQGKFKISSTAFQYLCTADRIMNHKDVVEPSLKAGKTVLSHRSLWSNVPHGLLDRGVTNYNSPDTKLIQVTQGLMSMYHQFIVPDTTFYLRVSVDTVLSRLAKMKKIKQIYEKKEKLEKIANGYEWQIKQFPKEFVVIDGEESEEEVTREIIGKISNS